MNKRQILISVFLMVLAFSLLRVQTARSATITVTTNNDVLDAAGNCASVMLASLPGPDGVTSLREAMCAANNNTDADTINFNITGAGVQTINLSSALPQLVDGQTTIDGYTQFAATLATGSSPASIMIAVNGTGIFNNGFNVTSSGNEIRGLAIYGFLGSEIYIINQGVSIANNNVIAGNYLGANASGLLCPDPANRGLNGVFIGQGAQNNRIGGDTPADRNLISCNGWEGVGIHGSGTTGNVVSGNYIGVGPLGTTSQANTLDGVRIYGGAQDNTVGGNLAGERNIISSNTRDGIRIVGEGTTGNNVMGNYIGTDAGGLTALGNAENGVTLAGGAFLNTVGGDTTAARNLISGNTNDGVLISDSGTMSNTVAGNYIGVDVLGTADLGNGYFGVEINSGAQNNLIGGDNPGARNLLSGNDDCGVAICGAGTMNNVLSGNYIGADVSGAVALANTYYGVYVCQGAQYNTIGGDMPGARNVVSGNVYGIYITDENTTGNFVYGNYIGLDASGTAALSNSASGVFIGGDAQNNTIGGNTGGERNVISGNDDHGVNIGNPGTAFNLVTGNYIGTAASGTATLANGGNGISLYNSTHDNTIGPGNLIAGSGENGIGISGSSNNTVLGNTIGTDASGTLELGNTENGVYIWLGADNIVGPGNVIAYNQIAGVAVRSDTAIGHAITQNSIFANQDLGIDLIDGANGDIAAPVITNTTFSGGNFTITGTTCSGCAVEMFGNRSDDGEGKFYLGSDIADGGGAFSLNPGFIPYPHLTATATDPSEGTSEFSAVFTSTVQPCFLPVIIRQSP